MALHPAAHHTRESAPCCSLICAWISVGRHPERRQQLALLLLDHETTHTMLDHAITTYSLEHDPKRSHQTKNRHIKPGYAAMPVRTHDSRSGYSIPPSDRQPGGDQSSLRAWL